MITFKQLQKLSKLIKIPISAFFLDDYSLPNFTPIPLTKNNLNTINTWAIRKINYYLNCLKEIIPKQIIDYSELPEIISNNKYSLYEKLKIHIENKNIFVFEEKLKDLNGFVIENFITINCKQNITNKIYYLLYAFQVIVTEKQYNDKYYREFADNFLKNKFHKKNISEKFYQIIQKLQ